MKKIAENIIKIRNLLSVTQKDFARKIGVSATHLNLIENGKKKPSLKLIYRICDKFNIDPTFVVARTEYTRVLRDLILPRLIMHNNDCEIVVSIRPRFKPLDYVDSSFISQKRRNIPPSHSRKTK